MLGVGSWKREYMPDSKTSQSVWHLFIHTFRLGKGPECPGGPTTLGAWQMSRSREQGLDCEHEGHVTIWCFYWEPGQGRWGQWEGDGDIAIGNNSLF